MKKILCLSLLVPLVILVFADTYVIGTGTSATSTNPYYGSYNYGWCKTIYTQAEISAAGLNVASDIIGIGFYIGNTPANYVMESQSVYLRHTQVANYETTDNTYPGLAQFDLVYQGTMVYNGSGWHYITFSTPFTWNGVDNLEFLYENRDIDNPTGYPTFRYTSTSPSYLTVYKGDDNSFPETLTGTRTYSRANIMLVTPSTSPPTPAALVYPADGATLVSPALSLSWSPGNIWPTGYRLSLGTDNPPTNVLSDVNVGNITSYNPNPDLQINTTYYWQVTPYNGFGDAENCPVWSFTTHGDNSIGTLPYFQHWDAVTAPNLPFDWTSIIQASVTTAVVVTYATSPYSAPNCARLYNGTDTAANVLLVGPQINDNLSVNQIRVRFQGKGGAAYYLAVGVLTDPTNPNTFTAIQNLNVVSNWSEYIVSLTGYTGAGRHIAFKHSCAGSSQSLYVDDVRFEQISTNDLACLSLTGNTTPSVSIVNTYTARIKNWGTATQNNYTVKLFLSNGTELATAAGLPVAPDATVDVPLNWQPTGVGPAAIYARVFLTGDTDPTNDQSPMLNIVIQPDGTVMITIGEGNLAEGVPLEFYYKSSLHQSIFYQTEMNVFGNITALTFYNNFVTNLPAKPCKFWLAQTDLNDLSAGWILNGLTLVYDGVIDFPSGANTITIPLQTPFSYNSGNLVLYAKRPLDTQYFNTNDNFQAQTVGTNRARKLYSDSVDYDPLAPSAAGTLSGTYPKTSFSIVTSGFSALQGTVTSAGNPVSGVLIAINGTPLTQTTNAAGAYNFPFVAPGAYTVSASKLGFETLTLPVILVADETSTLNFSLIASTSVNVSGTVVGSDQPTVGLPEAEIQLTGIMNYSATTNAQGQFLIPGVLSGNTYNYNVTKAGYQNLSGSVNIAAVDYNMGNLVLSEIAIPPGQVVATENIAQTQVDIVWSSPSASPPMMDFEFDDGGWVPSSNWTNPLGDFQWTNTYNVANYVVGGYPTSEFPPPTAHSGTGLWGTVLYAPYTNAGGFSYLTKEFSFSGITNPQLRFWSWNNSFGNWDYGQVAVNGTIVWGPAWDTSPVEWEEVIIDLSAFANVANVSIQFQHYTTTVVNYAGWYIDDVYVGAARYNIAYYKPSILPECYRGLSELEAAALAEQSPKTIVNNLALEPSRVLTGYKVWRLLASNQGNESLWNLITPSTITDTTFVDLAWSPLPSGVYKYAVKAVYTNNVLSNAVFSNELHKGMMGVLTGTVMEFGTGVPIQNAEITAGDYSGTSNAAGLFSFLVYQGTYEVTCAKAGYQTASQAGVVIVGTQTTTQNFVLTEITLPPASVVAEEVLPNVNITWMAPGTAGGGWLHYDSGDNNDSIGTGAAADFDVAVRFPPTALQDYAGMSLYAIKAWPAQAGTFSIRVWTGGTSAAPASMVVDQPFTPVLDTYNTVQLSNPVPVAGNEALWFGYRCNVTTGYPAGCDAGPAVDGYGNMMYYQGAWSTLLALAPSLDYNWNIQGWVGYSAPTTAPLITMHHPNLSDAPQRFSSGILATSGKAHSRGQRSVSPQTTMPNNSRTLNGYKVWRLIPGQETNENAWTLLTPNVITALSFVDTNWTSLPYGSYRWAVKAIYTGDATSIPAFSNTLSYISQLGTIAGIVRTMQNQPIQGATLTCGTVTATTNASGAYSMQVQAGTHSITASHPNYQSVTNSQVVVVTGQTTTVNFQLPNASGIVQDGFESYPNFALSFAPWTVVDVDQSTTYGMTGITWPNAQSAQAFIIFNPSATTPPATTVIPHTGDKFAAAFSATTPPNNDWLISPQTFEATTVKFWAKSHTAVYGLERFRVGVSNNTAPAGFTIISGDGYVEAPMEWTEYTYSLPYSATPRYVGIQCVSNDAFIFCVDDVSIGSPDAEDEHIPVAATELGTNYPNPFNPVTTISYSLKETLPVNIQVYNLKGQLVKTLIDEIKTAGLHKLSWNGTDNHGHPVSSGVYYYKMNAGKYSSTRKMILMK